jgi:hypothetical protein
MPENLTLTVKGLYTDPNSFSEVPDGALIEATDCVIVKPGVGESRRGQKEYGLLNGIPDKLFDFDDSVLAHYDNKMAYDSGNGAFVEYSGSFNTPMSAFRPRGVEASQNFYLTTDDGVKKLTSLTSQFTDSGGIQGLSGEFDSFSAPGFMTNNVQVAYRIMWGKKDANDNEIVGVPSPRLVVVNDSGSTADVTMTWQIPDDITTDYFYRVYRSGESAGVSSVPDDNLQQVKEGSPTSGEITAGEFTFTDSIPNNLRGAFLYTSPAQEGILQANEPPPFCVDMTLYKTFMFYFNTKSKQRLFVNLISVGDNTLGGSFGYQTNNGTTHTNTTIDGLTKAASIIIQDLTYTADTAGVAGNDISITYTGGGTAGAEVVTVSGNSISVQIQSGVSTATQVKTAVDASVAASALISVAVSGTGATAQTTVAQTFLEDGFDTTYLNVGMRVVGTGVVSGTLISSIDSISSITVDTATTASATVAMEFQDRFSIDSMNYWAASTADYANRKFIAYLDGTPGENIETTAQNLISAINQDPNNSTVYAFYTSNYNDLPGQILLQERGINGSTFAITSTNGESFSPVVPSSGTTFVSDNDAKQNRAMFSKSSQPEAVPIVNFLDIGSENYPILRGIALRDSVFVLKQNEGIFRITGTDPSNFNVSLFDSSASIIAPESAVVLNNQIFCFSDQGIIVISESGVQIISIPVESDLSEVSSSQFPNFSETAFGVSYETERQYILFTVSEDGDDYPTKGWVYNTITNAFTNWDLTRSCGIVLNSDNKLYMGNPDDSYIYQERKSFSRSDYCDKEFSVTVVSSDEYEITLSDTTDLGAGDVIVQDNFEAVIESVDSSTVITVSVDYDWVAGSATVYQKIPAKIAWDHDDAGNPGILKHFPEATFIFKDAPFYNVRVGFQTDLNSSVNELDIASYGSGWGECPWGETPWGAPGGKELTIRTYAPLEAQRGSWMSVSVENIEAFSNFQISGVSLNFIPMSPRQR